MHADQTIRSAARRAPEMFFATGPDSSSARAPLTKKLWVPPQMSIHNRKPTLSARKTKLGLKSIDKLATRTLGIKTSRKKNRRVTVIHGRESLPVNRTFGQDSSGQQRAITTLVSTSRKARNSELNSNP